jgi:hypothetical protein
MLYIANAFSLQMLDTTKRADYHLRIIPLLPDYAARMAAETPFTSAIGHNDTAAVVSTILGVEIPQNRINISLQDEDTLLVAQVVGGRLPEGATALPEGIEIQFVLIKIEEVKE